MPYTVIVSSSAEREIRKLPDHIRTPILLAMRALAINPRPLGCKKLVSKSSFRIRIGTYRIIYDIQDKQLIVEVIKVADRKEVYR
ncbi:MAG: type II toxin-antitoxin system RelE/ParE family toxin [Desulfomicrobium sp.]